MRAERELASLVGVTSSRRAVVLFCGKVSVVYCLPTPVSDLWLSCSSGGKYGRNGLQHDPKIQPEGPFIDVLQIQLHPLVEIYIVSARNLPKTGDSRLHAEPAPLFCGVVLDLLE